LTKHWKGHGVFHDTTDEDQKNLHPALIFPEGADREYPSPGYKGNRKLYVVTCISNPVRFSTRYNLYKRFAQHVEDSGAILYTVEMAFGDRPHVITSPDNPRHIQLRSHFELWHKENMLNIGIQALPKDWKYVAWIDSDVQFARPDWVNETIEQLQHYDFLQLFAEATDLGPRYQTLMSRKSMFYNYYHFGRDYIMNKPKGSGYYYSSKGSSGYAWAARRKALDAVGGLIDTAILGAGDWYMAHALLGIVDQSRSPKLHPNYLKSLDIWQDRAERRIKRNVGYMDGTVFHHYHGRKSNRGYETREQILIKHQFDPGIQLYKDNSRLWQLEDHSHSLRDDLRRYFRQRQEDDISEGGDLLQP